MLSQHEMILRLAMAAFLGGIIGFERERLSWAAGLRTHMLVCLGATLIMLVSQYAFHSVVYQGLIALDPSRVAAQVVSGIGFLGAGTILFLKNAIRGLTTAASLWAVAAVGLAVGGGLYLPAISATLLILLILAGLKPIERRFMKKNQAIGIRFSLKTGPSASTSMQEILKILDSGDGISRIQIEKSDQKEHFHILFKESSQLNYLHAVNELRKIKDVENIEVVAASETLQSSA